MAAKIEKKLGSELLWSLKHDGLYSAGKKAVLTLGYPMLPVAGATGAIFASTAGVLIMGGIAAVSAATAIMDYKHEKSEMKDLYRDEIAAKLGKDKDNVTVKDLRIVASGDVISGISSNHTITNGIRRIEDKRDLNVATSIIASLGSFVASVSAFATLGGSFVAGKALISGLALEGAAALGLNVGVVGTAAGLTTLGATISAVVPALALGIVGLAAYHAIRKPIRVLADKLWDYERVTAHEKVRGLQHHLQKGKDVSREQVFSVFVSANPRLANYIEDHTGKEYDALNQVQKDNITDHFKHIMDLDRFVTDINDGRINATELAFAVEGQRSGVLPKEMRAEPEQASALQKLAQKARSIFKKKEPQEEVQQQTPTPNHKTPVQFNNATSEVSFTERLSNEPQQQRTSFVDQVQESRRQAAQLAQQPST